MTQPDWGGELAPLGHSPNRARIDAEEFRHLANVDDRDVRLSNLKFIHECTHSAAASGINRLAGAGQREPRRSVRRGGLVC
jgi:hypothetical protein